MRDLEDFDHIATQTCDSCGECALGTMMHCRGTPVLFLCAKPHCGGHLVFERVARRDVDQWLETVPFSDSDFGTSAFGDAAMSIFTVELRKAS